jgi:hypothetical protein
MADKCSEELPGSLVETMGLAIELVGGQIKNSPTLLANILNSPAVQTKLKEALDKRLGELQRKATLEGRPIDAKQALGEIGSVFGTDTLDATKAAAKKEIEQTAKFRQLKTSLEGLSCRFKDSPSGFFYDESEGLLIILAVGVMVGGAVGMYVAKTGDADKPLALASLVANAASITVLGKVEVGLTDVVLKPSEKKYDAGLYAKAGQWKRIKETQLKVVVQTKHEKVAAVPVAVETKIELANNWFGTFGATYEPVKKDVGFSLGIAGTVDKLTVQVKANYLEEDTKTKYGAGADLKWKPKPGVTFTGGASASRIDESLRNPVTGLDDKSSKTDVRVNVGLKVEFW